MLADYHLHLENGPFTMDYLEQFLKVGKARGIVEFGFSEHAYNFAETRCLWPAGWGLVPRAKLADYLELIAEAKAAGLPVKLGIEMDYIEGKEKEIESFLASYPWDYVIGSVHHLGDWGFDHPDYRDRWETADVEAAYQEYFRLLVLAAKSGLFDIMAHPDVIKVFGYRPQSNISHLWEEAAQAMAAGGAALEISTAGLRKPVRELYPHAGFLHCCYLSRVPIVISSDAHYPKDVGKDFARAIELARQAGYTQISLFTQRRRTQVPLK